MVQRDQEGITITVTRSDGAGARIFHLTLRDLVLGSLVALSLLTAALLLGFHYYHMWVKTQDYARLQGELDAVRQSEQALRLQAGQLEEQLAALEVTSQKLRILSGLREDALGGLGGPRSNANPAASLNSSDLARHFRRMDQRRITLQAELNELLDYYTTREILLSATPSIMPVKGYPSDRFGMRDDPFTGADDFHPGIDISAPKGAKVLATADGLVVYAGRRLGYGNMVVLQHKFGLSTRYAHLDRFTVKPGQRVRKGDVIGYVGSTGRATGSHLHYEVRLRNQPLNPLRFFQEGS
ncbi:MAG: M23 family metallopeptidase [Acidobacteriota bacterium]